MPSKNDNLPLMVVPGLALSGTSYRPLLKQLRRHREVRAVNPPPDFPSAITWEVFDSLVEQAAEGAPLFDLVGHSLGGAVALHYAATHPERVGTVIAVAPVLFPFQRPERSYPHFLYRNFTSALRGGHVLHSFRVAHDVRVRNNGRRLYNVRRWAGKIDLSAYLSHVQAGRILWMDQEELIPQTQFRKLKDFPTIQREMVAGSHNDIIMNPRAIGRRIEELLND